MTTTFKKIDQGIYTVTVDGTFIGRVNRIAGHHGIPARWTGKATPVGQDIAVFDSRAEAVAALLVVNPLPRVKF